MSKHARSYDTLSYSFVHLTLNSEFKMIATIFNILVTRKKKIHDFRKVYGRRIKNLEFTDNCQIVLPSFKN